jgi:site-specific recombinase XerD
VLDSKRSRRLSASAASAPAAGLLNSSSPRSASATRAWRTRAVKQFFDWCDQRRLKLAEIKAITVATYIEHFGAQAGKPTVKQHLAALRQLFDYLTTGGIQQVNAAASVRGPRYVVKPGNPGAVV